MSYQIFPRTTWNIFGDSQRVALLGSESVLSRRDPSTRPSAGRRGVFPLGSAPLRLRFPKPHPCPLVLWTPGAEPAGSRLRHLLSSLRLSSAAQVIRHCSWTWGMRIQKSPRFTILKRLVHVSQETQKSHFDVFPWHLLWLCPPSPPRAPRPPAGSRPPPGQKQRY